MSISAIYILDVKGKVIYIPIIVNTVYTIIVVIIIITFFVIKILIILFEYGIC